VNTKILIVDDEAAVLRTLERLLTRAGYKVFTAQTGAQALAMLSQQQVAVLLSDFRMPEMAGNELLKEVKRLYPKIVGLILSGYADFNVVLEALNSGAAHKFLQKPWQDEQLLNEIANSFAEYERRDQSELRTQLLISSADALLEVDLQGKVLTANATLTENWQQNSKELQKMSLFDLLPFIERTQIEQFLQQKNSTLIGLDYQQHEVELSHRFSNSNTILIKIEQLEALPQFNSSLAELKNLLNHQQACQILDSEIATDRGLLAVAVLDIANFSLINEALGYQKTDLLINKTATLLYHQLKPSQQLVYLSADKFALILRGCTDEMQIQLQISECLAIFAEPIVFDERRMQLNFNVGYAIAPLDTVEADKLMKFANLACRTNKNNQHHFYMRFEQSILDSKKQQFEISNALYAEIENNGFSLNFQPKVSLSDGRIRQAEVLLRWNHHELGCISPALFIPIAERDGQIIRLGLWVLEQSFIALKSWQQQGLSLEHLSINVSGRQLQDPQFFSQLQMLLHKHQIMPEQIEIEVTETYLMSDLQLSQKVLGQIRSSGVHVSMDDFGTGYSSLAYLTKLPISEIKLDRSLVTELASDLPSQGMVRNMIRMAHDLGLSVTAEGIETLEQQQLLNSMDCDLIQGYFYSKPLPEQDFIQILQQQPFAGAT